MIHRDEPDRGSSNAGVSADRHLSWIASARRQFNDARTGGRAAGFWPATGLPPADSIPGYVIQSEVHRGGQGIVYRGLQSSTGRVVAIKVLREGAFASSTDRLRFEREVRVLGALQHPGVVTIHDYGAVDGSFYFTMDYIAGRPLDEFVRLADQLVESTLSLFAEICDAVNAAHLLGIVHRDIKPRNILIMENGRPFVLDFGLAKTIDDSDSDVARSPDDTVAGQFVGSLPWASPEQIRSTKTGVDTRTDVYSLGVVLYHALTRKFPYDLSGPPQQAIAAIQNAEPNPPRRYRRDISTDAETIILKCLSKNPDRRYRTAGDLADDLRACLDCRPISARRESAIYVMRKSFLRHRTAFAVAAGFVLLITGSMIFSAVQWRRTARERDKALLAQKEEEAAKKAAASDAAKASAVVEFLRTTLASANPNVTDEQDAKVSQVLQTAARELDSGSMKEQPQVEAVSRLAVAEAYYAIGRNQEAERHAQTALTLLHGVYSGDHPDIARCFLTLSNIRLSQNEFADAENLARQAVKMLRRIHGTDDVEVADALKIVASAVAQRSFPEAITLARESLAIQRSINGEQAEGTALAKISLARHLRHDRAARAESKQLMEEALAVIRKPGGVPRPSEADALAELGTLMLFDNDPATAEKYLTQALAISRQLFGENHQDVLACLGTLDYAYRQLRQFDKALEVCQESLNISKNLYGTDSLTYYDHLRTIATTLRLLDRDGEAEAKYREVLDGLIRIGHDQEGSGGDTRILLARVLLRRGAAVEAEKLARDTLAIDSSKISETHQTRTFARMELANALTAQKRFAEAEPLYLEAHERYKTLRTPNPTERLGAAERLVPFYEAWNTAEPGAGHAEHATKWREYLAHAQSESAKPTK